MKAIKLFAVAVLACAPAGNLSAATWKINASGTGDAPTIQAAVDASADGDTILVAPGTYTWTNQGTSSDLAMVFVARGQDHLVIRSTGGPAVTVIDAQFMGRCFFIQGWNYLTLEGFTIQNGVATANGYFNGGGVCMHLSYEVIRNCIFRYNSAPGGGGGLWCGGVSAPQIVDCEFVDNSAARGGAIYFIRSSTLPTIRGCRIHQNRSDTSGGAIQAVENGVRLEDCLITYNEAATEGGALYVRDAWPSFVTRCTISDNLAATASAVYALGTQTIAIDHCIVARGQIAAPYAVVNGSPVTLSCSDTWGNAGSDALPPGVLDAGGNLFVDPLFCRAGSLNYQLTVGSPCLTGACRQMGAFGAGCSSVAVRETTWGRVKARYR